MYQKRTALAALDLEQSAQSGTQQAQQEALDSLNKHSIDTFWTWDDKTQNRILLDLLGENRIAVYKGLIVGFTANRQKHGVRRKADE